MGESKEERLVKEESWLEAILAAVPPLIFLASILCFSTASSREHPVNL
jgi:hypothetical protein